MKRALWALALLALPPSALATRCGELPIFLDEQPAWLSADFDGDGLQDVLTGGMPDGGSGHMFWQGPGGTFTGPSSTGTMGVAQGFIGPPSDIDGDGDLDLAVTTGSAPQVFLNAGGRRFDAMPVPPPSTPRTLHDVLADLDADGLPDLLSAWSDTGRLLVRWNAGGGTFGPPQTLDGLGGPIAFGDMNGDGLADIVVAWGSDVVVTLSQPGRTFAPPRSTPLPWADLARTALAVGELVGGSERDVVVARSGEVAFLQGDGSGGFTVAQELVLAPSEPTTLLAEDATGDGRIDVVVGSCADSVLIESDVARQYAETDRVGVRSAMAVVVVGTERRLLGEGMICFQNSDGFRTLLSPPYAAGSGFALTWSRPNAALLERARLVDLDGDARLDVVGLADTMLAQRSGVPGGFSDETTHPLSSAGSSLAAGDLDGLNGPDVVVTDSGVLTVFWNQGGGALVPRAIGAGSRDVAVGDVDGNGSLDVVADGTWGTLVAHLNDGAGNFVDGPSSPTVSWSSGIVLARLDTDPMLDVARLDYQTSTLQVSFGIGDGSFGAPELTTLPVGACCRLLAADLDGDGDQDLVAGGPPSVVLQNDGGGGFSARASLPSIVTALADVDGMNGPDLIASAGVPPVWNRERPFAVEPWLNSGAGTFAPSAVVPLHDGPLVFDAAALAASEPVQLVALAAGGKSLALTESCLVPAHVVRSMPMTSLAPPTPPTSVVLSRSSFDDPGADGIPGTADDRYGPASFAGMRLDEPLLGTGADALVFYSISLDATIRLTKEPGALRLWY